MKIQPHYHPSPSEKRQSLLYLLKKHNVKHFVETGTYRGDTVAFLENQVDSVHTIELDEKLCLAAQQRFAGKKHVKCWHGCSGSLLDEVIKQCPGPALVWLDGHYSGGVTARGEEVSPILKEIVHLAQISDKDKQVILIDDARLFDGKHYPFLSDTLDWIKRHLPHHEVKVYNDMIFVEPPSDVSQMSQETLSLAYRFAPRTIISRDQSYQLYFGPHFDREAAWRAGFQDADCVSSIFVNKACRFGNSVQQWKHALGVALNHGLRRIYLPGFWWMKQGAFTLACGIEVVNQPDIIMSDEEVVLSGELFDIISLQTFSSVEFTHADAVQLLGEYLVARPLADVLADDHLVIHLRAGDIFSSKKVHPLYGQPPLAFYLNVLASQDWGQITLVAEDDANPVWHPLINHCKQYYSCDIREGMNLCDDVAFLLSAHTIVTARGSFAPGLSCLSPHWRKVITFENAFSRWGNQKVTSEIWKDVGGDYRAKLLSQNWANTPAQREMMLSYPKQNINKS